MKTKKLYKLGRLFLIAILSCCLIGGVVACDQSEEKGYSGTEYAPAITVDEEKGYTGAKYAPVITVDFGDFDENNVPNAVKGKPYKIFSATAEDLFGKQIYVKTRVWNFYDSQSRSLLEIKNNTVTPTSYGLYTVEFTAIDRWQNETTYLYDFVCEEKEELSINFSSSTAAYKTGDMIDVCVPSFINNVGKVNYSVRAQLKNSDVSYEVVDGKFVPLYAGEYDVVYTYHDYNETKEDSYSITVDASEELLWGGEPVFTEYMLVGVEYTLPTIVAYELSSGKPEKLPISIVAVDDEGSEVTLPADNKFKPTAGGEYTFIYKAEAEGRSSSREVKATAVMTGGFDGSDMDMSKYFITDNITSTEATSYGIQFVTETDGATAKFVNPINAKSTRVDLLVDKTTADAFTSIDVILTDSTDKANSVAFSIVKDGTDKSLFTATGSNMVSTAATFYNEKSFAISYDNDNRIVALEDSESVLIKKNLNGDAFTGFKGNSVFVTIVFKGVSGQASIKVLRLGNQVLYNEVADGVEPDVSFNKWLGGEVSVGDIVTLDRIYVQDVLCPEITVKYSVKNPDGGYVTDVNGVVLSPENTDYTKSYQFEILKDGRYLVTITTQDMFGNSINYNYPIISVSESMLTIDVLNDGVTEAKVGDTIKVSSFNVVGADPDSLVVRIFYTEPNWTMKPVEGDEFVAELPGEYVIWYYAYDLDSNSYMTSYTIRVS